VSGLHCNWLHHPAGVKLAIDVIAANMALHDWQLISTAQHFEKIQLY